MKVVTRELTLVLFEDGSFFVHSYGKHIAVSNRIKQMQRIAVLNKIERMQRIAVSNRIEQMQKTASEGGNDDNL